ncbi:MAG: acyltransferase [Cyclobacteriaceae bacterium]|nr:acyltransferase [Cyclobacteriaceae bacterium]
MVPSAQYDKRLISKCGEDVFISANVEIRRPNLVLIGSHVAIDTGFYLTTQADIGDYVHLGPYISVVGGAKSKLVVGDFATVAAGCRIIAGSDRFNGAGFTSVTVPEKYRDEVKYSVVRIGRFAGVGTNVVIMPGVELGEGCVIGANSLVTQNTQPWTIYYGSPARPIRKRPKERMLQFARELGFQV